MKTMSISQCTVQLLVACGCVLSFAFVGSQQAKAEWPEKPITMMVGYSAGGGTDTYARALASFMHEQLGQPMVVVNKPGAASAIAAKAVMNSRSDGYTLFIINGGTFLAKSMMLGDKAPATPLKDMQPLGGVGQFVTALMVPMDSSFKNPQDLIAHAKANPGKLRWSHPGRGSVNMLAGALFMQENDITAQDVPFKSGPKARNAVVSKQVDFAFTGIHSMAGFESKIRALGVTNSERDKIFNKVPTFGELGLPALNIAAPMVVWGKIDLPAEAVTKLKAAIKAIASSKSYQRILKKAGAVGFYQSNEQVVETMEVMRTKFSPIVAELKANMKKK